MDPTPADSNSSRLSTGDWLICLFCQLGGILIGASRCALGQWKSGLSMIGLSLGMALVWNLTYLFIQIFSDILRKLV